jgi:uncharacterized membrane protein
MRLHCRYSGTVALSLIFLLSILTAAVAGQSPFNVETISIRVYRDGLVHVEQVLSVDELLPQIELPLLSSSVENLLILDENQLAVDYQLDAENLTVFTLGVASITIEYDTVALTNKKAEVWTLILNNPYALTVFLPRNSTVVYLSQMPTAINTTGEELSLILSQGPWEISYVVPVQQEEDGLWSSIPIEYLIAVVAGISLILLITLMLVFRKPKVNVKKILSRHPALKKEDVAVIEFLAEKDGKAFEAEIRLRFPDMPRTSLWRLVRRLERLEIVEIKRIGLENQVQIKK